ncbi:beta-lactamase family protein [Planosporangium flavigriseum]|nr:serine hydrolase domain-containing protein [Planosporangium flavigriseum]NJC68035.1 beta-lactamase family protein [Planosporangium flavigriseum]
MVRRHGVPGAQLAIHRAGRTVTTEVGELEYRTGQPVTADTAFGIGSITKSFTATAAMVLVEDGDLELDEAIGAYVPGMRELGDELTLRCLLSHTAGLSSGPDPDEVSTISVPRYVTEYCSRRRLVLPPGTGFSYSNIGYVLVGYVIEAVTGMSWAQAVASIVLRPLGIQPAFLGAPGAEPPTRRIASGHSVNTALGRARPVFPLQAPTEAAAGALAMSATDLVALGQVHLGAGVPELLPARCAEQMRVPVAGAEPYGLADAWGLGLAVFREGTTAWVGHDGNADGTACYLRIDPVGGWVVALTSNANTGAALWKDILGELARAGVPIGRPRVEAPMRIPTVPPTGCAGLYVNGDVEYVVAEKEGRDLYLAVDGDGFARMTFYDHLTFTLQDPESGREVLGGRFLRNPATKEIHALQVGGRLARRRGYTKRTNAGHFSA